jgi:hypothetical protein
MRQLTYAVKLQYMPLSAEVIRTELAHVQTTILEDQKTNRQYALPSKPSKHAQKLFKLVGKTLKTAPFEMQSPT